MRLLLAEDERSLSRALVTILNRNGFEVDAVYDGKAALEAIESGNYDGVVLDIMMPKMNGLEVLKTIRDKENLIPILMLLLSKRAIEPVAESYEKQTKTTMIEFPFSEIISEEAQSFQGLAKVKGKNIILSVYNTSQPLTKENIDQRFDSKR